MSDALGSLFVPKLFVRDPLQITTVAWQHPRYQLRMAEYRFTPVACPLTQSGVAKAIRIRLGGDLHPLPDVGVIG